jgi:hypothetical protein
MIVLLAMTTLFYSAAFGDLGNSRVELIKGMDCYLSGERAQLCFNVLNASPDGEIITDVSFKFPADWMIFYGCRSDSGSASIEQEMKGQGHFIRA